MPDIPAAPETTAAPPRPPQPSPSDSSTLDDATPHSELRTGRCQCGNIIYQVTGVPDDPHLCSCPHETRISGGPAVLWVGFPKDSLKWTGPGCEPTWHSTWPTLHRGFCPHCGTHLISVADGAEMIMVTGFSLDDRTGTDPVGHSYRDEAAEWMTITLAPDPNAAPEPSSITP